MNIVISTTSEKPIYQQLFDQISTQILKGELTAGYSLPPIRQAATELRISVITVKKAWEELERAGLIDTVTGKGCFVADLTHDEMIQMRNQRILDQMAKDIATYKSFGLTREDVVEMLKTVY